MELKSWKISLEYAQFVLFYHEFLSPYQWMRILKLYPTSMYKIILPRIEKINYIKKGQSIFIFDYHAFIEQNKETFLSFLKGGEKIVKISENDFLNLTLDIYRNEKLRKMLYDLENYNLFYSTRLDKNEFESLLIAYPLTSLIVYKIANENGFDIKIFSIQITPLISSLEEGIVAEKMIRYFAKNYEKHGSELGTCLDSILNKYDLKLNPQLIQIFKHLYRTTKTAFETISKILK